MKHFFNRVLFFLSLAGVSFPQIIIQPDSLIFQQVLTGESDSLSIKIINYGNFPAELFISIKNDTLSFKPESGRIEAAPQDSAELVIKFSPVQNVLHNGSLFIYNSDTTIYKILKLQGSGGFADGYYSSTFNLYDLQLLNALTSLVGGHTYLGYNLARDKMFMEIDNQKVNGQGASQNTLECVYTGRMAVGYTSRSDAQTNHNFNTEHTWPQSMFNSNDPMQSDLFHLYPTDETANSIRGNLPFGNAVSGVNWQNGGSKRGLDSAGQLVFEPRDVHKGNTARTMFYFVTRYTQNYGSFFSASQEKVFRRWNGTDMADSAEIRRNMRIAQFQGKRNPYIDHPEFVDRIYSFLGNARPEIYAAEILPAVVKFDSAAVGDTLLMDLHFINNGNKEAFISQVVITNPNFNLADYPASVKPGESGRLSVRFIPESAGLHKSSVIVSFNNQTVIARLQGAGFDSVTAVNEDVELPDEFMVYANFPNPFNPSTVIKFSLPEAGIVKILIHNIAGELAAEIYNRFTERGTHSAVFNAAGFPSGVYFYTVETGKSRITKSMILIK